MKNFRQMRNYSRLKNIVFVICFLIQLSACAKDYDTENELQSESDLFGEGSKQLSEINILLPIQSCKTGKDCRKAYQTVVAYHGCFEWRISHPNLIDMEPVPSQSHPECTNVVRISNAQQRETKSVIWLTAKDKRSGQALTAEITVGKVNRLEIFARFRQIPKGDRQQLQVRAYDDEGNVFSTLDGFNFDWTEVSGGSNILRISRDQAEYRGQKASALRNVQNWYRNEYKNHGDYFLKAQENGVTTLEVKMLEKGYEKLPAAKITLTIVDPFIILAAEADEDIADPNDEGVYAPAYILPTSQFSFKLALIRNQDNMGAQLKPIQIPSSKYLWELAKQFQSLGTIDKKGEFQSLNKPGRVEINVIDQDFKNNTAHVDIFIVEPVELRLEIADVTESYMKQAVTNSKTKVSSFRKQLNVTNWAKEWLLVEDKHYLIKAYLYDKDHNRIFQTRQLDFQSTLDKKYFELVEKNLIGSELIVKVKQLGKATQSNAAPKTILRASLNEVKSSQRNKFKIDSSKLKDEKEITLTRPVEIVHPNNLILLPHIKSMGDIDVGQSWHVRAVGGAGSYTWRTADPSVARVGQPHLVTCGDIYAGDVGLTVLTVADLRNPDNFATIQVEVQPVHHLLWLQDRVEALSEQQTVKSEGSGPLGLPSGSDGISTLSTIAVDSQKRRFTNCTELSLSYDVRDQGQLVSDPSKTNWAALQKYVRTPEAQELIKLQNKFAQQPDAVFQSDLLEGSDLKEDELQYNSFGICRQIQVKAEGVGLARVKAIFDDPERKIESTDAEIASYTNLVTVKPEYSTFLQDLYSRSQSGQEFQTFGGFATDGKKLKHFIFSFGSTITLELTGGSHFWGELSDEYKTEWNIKNRKGTSEDVLSLIAQSETADSTLITVQCGAPTDLKNMDKSFDYTVLITQQGKVSKHLLKPVKHQESVIISCTPPQSQRLLWAQSSSPDHLDAPANLPRSRLNENIRTFSALVNSENYLRLLIFDKKGHASMNHSSIITTFSSSDSALASLSEAAAHYDKRLVKFHNQTGTVFIDAVSQKYNGDMMNTKVNQKSSFFGGGHNRAQFNQGLFVGHAVKDQVKIEIVKNLDIEPRFKSIYFKGNKNPYTFHLSQGSGHFAVKVNDTESLVDIKHHGRQVTITPKSEGSLLITVEDVDLPESLPVTAELLISSVARLNLDTQGYLIEKGSSTNMTVTALDSYGIEFDQDQYHQMAFEIEIEKTDIENDKTKGNIGLSISQILGEKRNFNATGIERGHYGVTAHIENFRKSNGQNLKTSTTENKIEVFPALRLQPDKLLLTPQMKYTLKVEGGPSRSPYGANAGGGHVVTHFNITNPTVASIDSSNEVTGETTGDSILRVQIYHIISANKRKDHQEWRSLVSEKQIFVKVRLVTSIAIPDNQQRMVYTGSLLKQLAVLKYHNETFTHGIAPVSFSWNCSNPDILEPNPSLLEPLQYQRNSYDRESDSKGQSRHSHQITTKTIRDNLKNNAAVFSSSFNSSGIHARALRAGEATLQVTMAIEYPKVYRRDQNWFKTSALLKVQDQLTVAVPEFIPDADKHTHLYLLPPRTTSKISTNKKTRLKLGYSMQSVYDYSSKRFEYREAKTPIIQLVDNEAIRTLDKYGKVTVHIAEDQAWGDQVVMLNVLIADIYSLSATHKHNFYEALSLPLGSTLKMPIKFQNEHAHLFANGIEGVEVGIQLSHPSVVTAQLDRYNQSLTLDSQGSGECNVVLYLINNPDIFDVFKVRVATLVQPASPVHLHVGSQVSFKIVSDSQNSLPSGDITWSSSASSILSIDSQDGTAVSLDEGSANILLSGKKSEMELEAASIAHVSQVTHAEVEQNGWNDLLLDVEEASHLRIRLKLFLGNQVEELMPVVQYDGVTLIRQNVQLKCQTDQPRFVEARAEVNDVEGYFCNVRYVGPSRGSHKDTPQRARVKATVSTAAAKGRGNTQPRPYSKDLLSFDVALVGRLVVDRKHRNGVKLGQFSRSKDIIVHSLSDFDVKKSVDDKTLRVQRSRDAHDSNDHTISMTITRPTNHTVKTEVTLIHRVTGETVVIPITFDPKDNSGSVYDSPPKSNNKPKKPKAQNGDQKSDRNDQEPGKAPSATAYIMFLFLVFLVIMFFSQNPNVNIPNLFTGCSRKLQALMNSPAGGYNNDNSRDFYSARGTDASRYGASSTRQRNPYAGVRDSVFSPDGKARQSDAPYNRFQQSRGSVVSPHSMYRRVDGDSARHSQS